MNNFVELKFEPIAGDAYNIELRGGIEGKLPEVILTTQIPAFDPNCYRLYQQACRKLYDRQARIGLKSKSVITTADLAQVRQNLDISAANLLDTFNSWGVSPQFAEIAQAIADRAENLRVTISTECTDLRRLPFHQWQLFPQQTEAIFSGITAKVLERTRHPDKIRLLVILGDKTGIDIEADKHAIEDYCQGDAELVFLTQPTRAELTVTLADAKGWDIIFFSGHSDTEGDTGRIYINATDSLTMAQLKDVLKPAIEQRVQIAIFNSCDGLGITPVLEKLNIDRLIVMREPIPDLIAQEFLKSFLKAFTGGARFDDAVKSARQHLVSFEDKYPYVSWLPIVIQNRLVTSPTWQSLGKIRSPYKGLAAFTEADADNFYGREDTIDRVADLVSQEPLVPIFGASGSGKSSLVQAGLIPKLRQDLNCNWQILTMRPGSKPFDALAQAITNTNLANLDSIALDIELASEPSKLTTKLAQMRIPQHRLLLFIDQFEELFTQVADPAICQKFLQSLADAVRNAPNFVLVFTLRDDFSSKLQNNIHDDDFRPLLERYRPQPLVGMTRDRLKAAITAPVSKLNVEFEGGLVDRLWQDVGNDAGSLPLLQLVLDLLWQHQEPRLLTHNSYDAICGDRGLKIVLANLAEQIYDGYVKQDRVKQFKQVFLRLVTLGDGNTPNTRRTATYAEIGEHNWREIVVPLSTERLLTTDRDRKTHEETVEIIHETLIRSWQRLTGWIEDCRHELERIEEIETAAIRWDRHQRSQQDLWSGKKLKAARKFSQDRERFLPLKAIANDFLVAGSKKQRWTTAGVLMVLGTIVPGLALLAWSQWRQAQLNEANALGNAAMSLVNRGQNLDGLVTAIKAGRILQAQQASNPIVTSALQTALDRCNERNRLSGHQNVILSVSFSPDGKTLASGSDDKTIKLWDLATGKELQTLSGHQDEIYSVSFSPDGKTLASGSRDKTIKLWDLATGKELQTLSGHQEDISSVSFSPDGKTLASGSWDKTIKLWDLATGKELQTLSGHQEGISSVRFSPDGKTLASGSWDKTIKLWDLTTDKELQTLSGHQDWISSVRFSPDGKTLASGSHDKTIKLWDLATGKEIQTLSGHQKGISSVSFSPDGKTLASGSHDKTIKLWDLATGKELQTLSGHQDMISSVRFSPDGKTLASGSWDKTIKLWDLTTDKELQTLSGHQDKISSVSFSPDGKTLASGSDDKTIKLWDLATGKELQTLSGHQDKISSVSFSPDGKTLASGSWVTTIKLWDLATGQELQTLSQNGIYSVSFSPDGKTLASGSDDNIIKLWDLVSGQELQTLSGHQDKISSVSFSPDGKTLASGSDDKTIKLWDLATGKELQTLSGHQDKISSVRFSPDGKTLASGSHDKTIKLWDLATDKELQTLSGHQEFIYSVSFSPDGKTLASGSRDKTIKLWDLATGKEIQTLSGHKDWISSVSFSPDGKTLASGSDDKTIKVWHLGLDVLMGYSCDWARAYLENNINVSQSDKHLCDGIGTTKQ